MMKLAEYRQKLLQDKDFVEAKNELQLHFDLANAVLEARLKKGLTQTELAEAIGTKQANISKIEAGLGNPTLALIQKLTSLLEIDVQFGVRMNLETIKALEDARHGRNLTTMKSVEKLFTDFKIR